ncbi:hypothetical protein Tco_0001606 [Tanacetum coccineum]
MDTPIDRLEVLRVILFSIHSDEWNPASVIIKQHYEQARTVGNPVKEILLIYLIIGTDGRSSHPSQCRQGHMLILQVEGYIQGINQELKKALNIQDTLMHPLINEIFLIEHRVYECNNIKLKIYVEGNYQDPRSQACKRNYKGIPKNTRIHAARDRQKSYADVRRKPLEFQVGDEVMLKFSPWKGVIRFGKQGKLNPRYIGPFRVLTRFGPVAYRLELPQELSGVHNTFHVYNMKKCLSNETLVIPVEEIEVDDKLHFIEEPAKIMDQEIKELKQSHILIVKV